MHKIENVVQVVPHCISSDTFGSETSQFGTNCATLLRQIAIQNVN